MHQAQGTTRVTLALLDIRVPLDRPSQRPAAPAPSVTAPAPSSPATATRVQLAPSATCRLRKPVFPVAAPRTRKQVGIHHFAWNGWATDNVTHPCTFLPQALLPAHARAKTERFSTRTARVCAEPVSSSTTNWILRDLRPTAGWTASRRSAVALSFKDNAKSASFFFIFYLLLLLTAGQPKMCHWTDPFGRIPRMRVAASLLLQHHLRPLRGKPRRGDGHVSTRPSSRVFKCTSQAQMTFPSVWRRHRSCHCDHYVSSEELCNTSCLARLPQLLSRVDPDGLLQFSLVSGDKVIWQQVRREGQRARCLVVALVFSPSSLKSDDILCSLNSHKWLQISEIRSFCKTESNYLQAVVPNGLWTDKSQCEQIQTHQLVFDPLWRRSI